MAAVTRRLLASPFALLHNTRSFSSCAPLWTLSTSGEPTAHTAARAASRQQQAAPAAAGAVDAAGRHSRGKRTRSWEAFAAMAGAPLARDIVTAGSVVLREVREGGGGGRGTRATPGEAHAGGRRHAAGTSRSSCQLCSTSPPRLPLQPADEVPDSMLGTQELRDLVQSMIDTMRAAPGVGLAAPQIGVPLQVGACRHAAGAVWPAASVARHAALLLMHHGPAVGNTPQNSVLKTMSSHPAPLFFLRSSSWKTNPSTWQRWRQSWPSSSSACPSRRSW